MAGQWSLEVLDDTQKELQQLLLKYVAWLAAYRNTGKRQLSHEVRLERLRQFDDKLVKYHSSCEKLRHLCAAPSRFNSVRPLLRSVQQFARRLSDRTPFDRWFVAVFGPICSAAVCFVVVDLQTASRSMATIGAVAFGVLLATVLILLLLHGSDLRISMEIQDFKRRVSAIEAGMSLANHLIAESVRLNTEAQTEMDVVNQERNAILKEKMENDRKDKAKQELTALNHEDWRSMRGVEFEQFLCRAFRLLGYNVNSTQTSGDQGVDITISRNGKSAAIQVKGYTRSVGNSAVQEVFAGKAHYKCDGCVVITNSTFTKSARKLASSTMCLLIDQNNLRDYISGKRDILDWIAS